MIKYIDDTSKEDLIRLCAEQTIFSCRIMCWYNSYGLHYDFLRFWVQYVDGSAAAAIAKYYDSVTVFLTDKSDMTELRNFLEMTGFSNVVSEKMIFKENTSVGTVMTLSDLQYRTTPCESVAVNPDLNGIYRLLSRNKGKGFAVPSYEDFILDVSHKIRHGTMRCTAIKVEDEYISAAMTVAESENCAVIGGVVTDQLYRRRGYGSVCVRHLIGQLCGKQILVMREKDSNEAFYQSLGFVDTGVFVTTEVH